MFDVGRFGGAKSGVGSLGKLRAMLRFEPKQRNLSIRLVNPNVISRSPPARGV